MFSETVITALIASGTGLGVALLNAFPQMRASKKLTTIGKKVDNLEKYIKNDKDETEIRKKMEDIQAYYINQMTDEELRSVAIMKSDSFITLIVDFGMGLDLDNINDYKKFQDHLFSGSKYCRIRMAQILGEELTFKYYSTHDYNTIRFNKIIEKIFFTTENSKKVKLTSAAVDFMQLFMTEMICLKNGKQKEKIMDECNQKYRRKEDHT
jgi:hypothetical protein